MLSFESQFGLLAEGEIAEWIRILVILLVVGGSFFGKIGKKLIERFSPQAPEKPQAPNVPTESLRRDPTPPVARPSRPVARPAPPPPRVPVARAAPVRPVAPQRPVIATAPAARRPVQPPVSAKTETPRREVTPTPVGEREPESRRRRQRAARTTAPPSRRKTGNLEARVDERFKPLESSLEHRAEQIAARVEKHLGRLKPQTAPAARPDEAASESEGFARPSRSELRRAVVLREILSPPIALRAPEENW